MVNNFGASMNNRTTRVHVVCRETGMKIRTTFLGPAPTKFPGAQIGAILEYFRL